MQFAAALVLLLVAVVAARPLQPNLDALSAKFNNRTRNSNATISVSRGQPKILGRTAHGCKCVFPFLVGPDGLPGNSSRGASFGKYAECIKGNGTFEWCATTDCGYNTDPSISTGWWDFCVDGTPTKTEFQFVRDLLGDIWFRRQGVRHKVNQCHICNGLNVCDDTITKAIPEAELESMTLGAPFTCDMHGKFAFVTGYSVREEFDFPTGEEVNNEGPVVEAAGKSAGPIVTGGNKTWSLEPAAECSMLMSCSKCSQVGHCGWCLSTGMCLHGDEDGPISGSCKVGGWDLHGCSCRSGKCTTSQLMAMECDRAETCLP